ncbi:MAG: NTP transferase domain-containing protein [Proteobacteria bacterium]|nr:NTP transferase domain-containing protein [Pseudomonadota bacterium]
MMNKWNAVVLAGDRGPNDPLLQATGVTCKAAVRFSGQTQLSRVISALAQAEHIDHITIVGPDTDANKPHACIQELAEQYQFDYLAKAEGPSLSAIKGLEHRQNYPCLIATCDVPFITSQAIDDYCAAADSSSADFVVAAVPHQSIIKMLPTIRKTTYTFDQRLLCFSNLFAVRHSVGKEALHFWREMEKKRKNPLQIIARLGIINLIKYKFGKMTLKQASAYLSTLSAAKVEIILRDAPEISVDVDSVADYELLKDYL